MHKLRHSLIVLLGGMLLASLANTAVATDDVIVGKPAGHA